MAYRNYSPSVGFTVSQDGSGDFTTIGAALTAATSGTDIFIRPGTYTENPTLKAGVNLVAFLGDQTTPNVIINGKCTATFTGTCSISGIQLQTNSDFCLAVTGTNATNVNLVSCYIYALNNTAIQYTTSGGGKLNIYNCIGDTGTTGIAFFVHSSTGKLSILSSLFANDGGTATASSVSGSGGLDITKSDFFNNITTSSTNSSAINVSAISNLTTSGSGSIDVFGIDMQLLTLAGTGTSYAEQSLCTGGASSAISIGSGTTLNLFGADISSTNTNAISGSGTLNYSGIAFTDTSSTIQNTVTLNLFGSTPSNASSGYVLTSTGPNTSPSWQAAGTGGELILIQSQTASSSSSLDFTTGLTTYNTYLLTFSAVAPVANSVEFNMLQSTNGGVSYLGTGNYAAGVNVTAYNSATATNTNSTAVFPLAVGVLSAEFISGFMYINIPTVLQISGQLVFNNGGISLAIPNGQGVGSVNALRFIMSSGNIAGGTITLYGIKNT